MTQAGNPSRVGLLIVGLGGAVASTVAAGLELIRRGSTDRAGLPLTDLPEIGLVPYDGIEIAGWDLSADDLATAAARHRVLPPAMLAALDGALGAIQPWAGVGDTAFCRNADGNHRLRANSHLGAVEQIRQDIRGFAERTAIRRLVVVNLASVEKIGRASCRERVYATV